MDAIRSRRYKGTSPFQDLDLDRRTFFGRDRESRLLLNLVLAEALVVLFAKSAMGKTSLINARLVGTLRRRGYFPMVVRLGDPSGAPVRSLLDGVRLAAHRAKVDCLNGVESSLWSFFNGVEFWSESNDLLRPVLIVDQFEELFTLFSAERRCEFSSQLAELVRGRLEDAQDERDREPPDLKIVLALREDFLANLEEMARDIPGILSARFRLDPLTHENARSAIVRPARINDDSFESPPFSYQQRALDDMIAFLAKRRRGDDTVEADAVEPVQLQLICQYMEEKVLRRQKAGGRAGEVEISEGDLGGEAHMGQVLENFYDRTLLAIEPRSEARAVRRLVEQRLISAAGRRLTEDEDEIAHRFKVSKQRLHELVDARLLRAELRLGGTFYELSHDTLVDAVRRSRSKRLARRKSFLVPSALLLFLLLCSVIAGLVHENRALLRKQLASKDPFLVVSALTDSGSVYDDGSLASLIFSERDDVRGFFGRVVAALDDVLAREPETPSGSRERLRGAFIRAIQRAPPAADSLLNERVRLDGGDFYMGSLEGEENERPRRRVRLSPFYIQEHEVTNEEYWRFDPEHRPDAPADHPVVEVSWFEALAYATWLGGALPTEAQWELAAKGKREHRYPWGDEEPTSRYANYGSPELGETMTVEAFPDGATPMGVHDLAGNVLEWCRDRYAEYDVDEQADPRGPSTGAARVLRGGSFRTGPESLRSTRRLSALEESAYPDIGFRVAFSLESIDASRETVTR